MKLCLSTLLAVTATLHDLARAIPVPVAKPDHLVGQDHPAGEYIVIMDEKDPMTIEEMVASMGLQMSDLTTVWNTSTIQGFVAPMQADHVSAMDTLGSAVKCYEQEVLFTTVQEVGTGAPVLIQQNNAPWGLQRVSSTSPIQSVGPGGVADFDFSYRFDQSGGAGVDVYVVDTGINVQHVDFGGRATMGFSVDGIMDDVAGHGTHVSGTTGSRTFGVAKQANLIGVKVFSGPQGQGSTSQVVSGIQFAIQQHQQRQNEPNFAGSVVNMSLGAQTRSRAMEMVIATAVQSGMHFAVAAGNSAVDACTGSPGAASTAIPIHTVGAITIADTQAGFSNFGQCVTINAPGAQITSSWIGGDNVINTISGTSMASPHVAGMIAYMLPLNPALKTDPAGMRTLINSMAGTTETGGLPMLNNGFTGTPL